MKLGPVTNLDKRNATTLKTSDDDHMIENYYLIVIFPIYGQFGAIRKTDFGRMLSKTYIFVSSNLLSYKNWKHK